MKTRKSLLGVLRSASRVLALLVALTACSEAVDDSTETAAEADPVVEGLSVSNAHVREPAPGQLTVAAFVTFNNNSDTTYRLDAVTSPMAKAVEVHRTTHEDGVMAMRAVDQLVVSAGGEVVFKPGAYHLMLSQLTSSLVPGDEVPLVFHFENGKVVEVSAEVRSIR